MNTVEQLKSKERWNETERMIGEYILNNRDIVINMSVQQLSSVTYASTSTIFRMCRKLGFEGYADFKIKFAAELQKGNAEVTEQVDPDFPILKNDSFFELSRKIYNLSIECMNITYNRLDPQKYLNAARIIMNSKKILMVAIGNNYASAMSFIINMNKIGVFPVIDISGTVGIPFSSALTENDCAILISYSGEKKSVVNSAKYLHKHKIPTISICSKSDSSLGRYTDICLQTVDNECYAIKNSTFASQTSIGFVLNVLYACCFQTDYDKFTSFRIATKKNQCTYEDKNSV